MNLFSFATLTGFPYPSLETMREGDPLWTLEITRRRDRIAAARDDGSPHWLLTSAECLHDVAEFRASVIDADRAMSLTDDPRVAARALLLQAMCWLSIAEGCEANRAAHRLSELAAGSDDPYVLGHEALLWGLYQEKNLAAAESGPWDGGRVCSTTRFAEAERLLLEADEIDYAIRARVAGAEVKIAMGRYLTAMEMVLQASELAQRHGRWSQIGRMLLIAGTAATDQGYRRGVEKTLREGIAWCHYLGDVWGRTDGWVALGRLLAYEMPAGEPTLALEPDRYLLKAVEAAEKMGSTWMVAGIDNTRAWLFRKAGNDLRSRKLLGEDTEEKGPREKLASDSTEVTERITEDIRRKTASRLHDGVENSADAFFVFDALRDEHGTCRDFVSPYTNLAAIQLVDRDPCHVCIFSEARDIPHLVGLEAALFRAVEHRETFEDIHATRIGEADLWFHRRVVPSGDGAVVTIGDVTAEKRIETALRSSAESAARSERAKSAFLANMSHEIRTPLNGVLGLARMLAETPLDATQRAYLDDIILSGDILLDLIGDVLDVSKIESHDMRLSAAPVFLSDVVAGIAKLFRGQAEEKSNLLTYRIDPSVPKTVMADGVRLRQILANLVGNAVKFTREGKIEIAVSARDELVIFEIRDTGTGIPQERIDAIFDRFQQAGSPTAGGTGLGLTISKALAELMGGDVRVESQLGLGSCFTVLLPLPEVRETQGARSSTPLMRFEGRRILLVDDNRVNLLVSTHALRKLGCEVVQAEDGQKALDALSGGGFDLVLMDVRMPVLDGLEATRELRRREAGLTHMPVVALTAGALLHEQQECFEAGMDDFASKPFTAESIRDVLGRWIGAVAVS